MERIDEIYNQIKNDDFKCVSDCPYQHRKECTYKQSCIYVKATKLALREIIMKGEIINEEIIKHEINSNR